MNIIKPTVGRRVYFRPMGHHRTALQVWDDTQPCDAGIVYVWGDRMVNLLVTGPNGAVLAVNSVTFVHPGDTPPAGQSYVEWMPYQIKPVQKLSTDEIARICHEANRAYCASLGDLSQPAWDDAPKWQRDSAVTGVKLHLRDPDAGPDASHRSWMAAKLAAGWVYGAVKAPDAVPPTHHCLVPFEELPVEQQAKDFIFRAVVHAAARA